MHPLNLWHGGLACLIPAPTLSVRLPVKPAGVFVPRGEGVGVRAEVWFRHGGLVVLVAAEAVQ